MLLSQCLSLPTTTTRKSSLKSNSLIINKCFGLILLITCSSVTQLKAEYFSSIDSLQMLGDIELTLVKTFQKYLDAQQMEFASYRKFIEQVKLEHALALKDAEDYLGNPINAFTLIKRMVEDWSKVGAFINTNQPQMEFQQAVTQIRQEEEMPDESEVRGAAKGLARLQNTYNISAYDLVDGVINGIDYGAELSWYDCFEIAVNLFQQELYERSIEWFEITLELLENEDDDKCVEFKIDSEEYIALAHYELGLLDKAINYIDNILEKEPNHKVKDIRFYISQSNKMKKPEMEPTFTNSSYLRLCRGIRLPDPTPNRFSCRIDSNNNPMFVLAPLKIEPIFLDPEIILYHQMLNDEQIEKIRTLVENDMVRSTVVVPDGRGVRDLRVSQTAWLNYETPIMTVVKRMVAQVTGLDATTADRMQVVNYGIGGQYEAHPDVLPNNNSKVLKFLGNRLITNMFYLSDVEQGGYTVFPYLNTFVKPIKGALITWYNLHKSLDSNWCTVHAGCPVIKGSKRIGNIWIHSGYQEFRHPCDLESDKYKSNKCRRV